MEAMEAAILEMYPISSALWSLIHPRGLLSGSRPGYSTGVFAPDANKYVIRPDNGNPKTVLNVFSSHGDHLYSIERLNRFSTLWTIYEYPTRVSVALVKCGLLSRTISFLRTPELHQRKIGKARWLYGGLPDRTFFLNDGAPYRWTYGSQYLERVVNPGGGSEEVRERLARMRLLRPGRFEWELQVDPKFDHEVALATGLISLFTQWTTWQNVVPGARSLD